MCIRKRGEQTGRKQKCGGRKKKAHEKEEMTKTTAK